jgi:Cft2 family RNA processing exonuclease
MIVEAGVYRLTYTQYREGIKPPDMCIVSHKHTDHYKYFNEFKAFIPAYLQERKNVSTNFKALGFDLKHGEVTSTAYIIKSEIENKFVFFGTDFEFSEEYEELFETLKYYKVENYLIECNYNDYLFHLATDEQRIGCSRHLSDNDVIKFIKKVNPKNPKIITIHGSERLSTDTYTKKYISSKLLNASVAVSTGVKGKQKNLFTI